MSYQPGDAWTKTVPLYDSTGASTDADSLPTAVVHRNGVLDAAVTVTVSLGDVGTGLYRVSATIPDTYAPGDRWEVLVTATMGGKVATDVTESIQLGSGLSGPSSVTLTFHDAGGNPVPHVEFTVVGQGSDSAASNGTATFGMNDGTYTVTAAPTAGMLFADTTLTVSGTTALTITGTAIVLLPASDPTQSRGSLRCYTQQGDADPDAQITIQQRAAGTTGAWPSNSLAASCDDDGDVVDPVDAQKGLRHARGIDYRARRGTAPADDETVWVYYTVPNASTFTLPAMLGKD